MPLVLQLEPEDVLCIGKDIQIKYLNHKRGRAIRVGIEAPKYVKILRQDIIAPGNFDPPVECYMLSGYRELWVKTIPEGMEVSVDEGNHGYSINVDKNKNPNTFLALQQLAIAIDKDKENAGT